MKSLFLLPALLLAVSATAQLTPSEAPSTVNATYVDPSATRQLKPGEKIAGLYARNYRDPYVLQRLTERTYWFQRQYYGTTFYVGDDGVLLFDPLEYRASFLLQAVKQVTPLPVTAVVYSHYHGDHIGDAQSLLDALAEAGGTRIRLIASAATIEKMALLGSRLPKATEPVAWPRGSFKFENLTVELHGFERAAHTDDHPPGFSPARRCSTRPTTSTPISPHFGTSPARRSSRTTKPT